jgi:hypothetical protein
MAQMVSEALSSISSITKKRRYPEVSGVYNSTLKYVCTGFNVIVFKLYYCWTQLVVQENVVIILGPPQLHPSWRSQEWGRLCPLRLVPLPEDSPPAFLAASCFFSAPSHLKEVHWFFSSCSPFCYFFFELRTSHLLGMCSTTWALSQPLLLF